MNPKSINCPATKSLLRFIVVCSLNLTHDSSTAKHPTPWQQTFPLPRGELLFLTSLSGKLAGACRPCHCLPLQARTPQTLLPLTDPELRKLLLLRSSDRFAPQLLRESSCRTTLRE